MQTTVMDVFRSECFWSAFCAWLTAQSTKMFFAFRKTHRIDFSYFVSIGGMPSAHTAMATGLATAVGLKEGFGSSLFTISLAFMLVVMLDAATVRRAAGQQARLLNEMVDELFKERRFSETKLVELLGHTRIEVLAGMIMGILVALIVTSMTGLF